MERTITPYSGDFRKNIKNKDFLEKSLEMSIDKQQFLITSLMVLVTEDMTPEILSQIHEMLDILDSIITIKYYRELEDLFDILVRVTIKKNTEELKNLLVYFVGYSKFFEKRVLKLLIQYESNELIVYLMRNAIISSNLSDLILAVSTSNKDLISIIATIYEDVTPMDTEYYYLQSFLETLNDNTKDMIKSHLPFIIYTS